jgi:hypothetical protein
VQSSDRNLSRELVELRATIGTSVSRVYGFNSLDLSNVKHVIEPEISYLFIPSVNQGNIPIMDDVDRIKRRNVFTFAVTNRLWGKVPTQLAQSLGDQNVELLSPAVTGEVRQMASLRMAVAYDLDKERNGGDSLTDIDLNFNFTPTPYLAFGLASGINPGAWNVTQARATFGLTDPRPRRQTLDADFNQPNSMSLSYQFLGSGPNSFLADDANINLNEPANCVAHPTDPRCPGVGASGNTLGNVIGNMLYHATDNLMFNFSSTYDALNARWIGFRAITKVLSFCECWSFTFGIKHDVNPAKTSFNFDFNLLGLGNSVSSLKK